MDDLKILALLTNNKQDQAFARLYKYLPVVKKMVAANGGKAEDAEDLYQEALIVFYKKAQEPGFKLTASITTYLYSICRFMWKDQQKKLQKQAFTELGNESSLVDENEFAMQVAAESHFLQAEQVISNLGERCRELLIRFYVHSQKLKDIAKKMGYNSENTVKNQKYKCLEAAKNKLRALKQA